MKPFATWCKEEEALVRKFVQRVGFAEAQAIVDHGLNESSPGTTTHALWAEWHKYLYLFRSVGRIS